MNIRKLAVVSAAVGIAIVSRLVAGADDVDQIPLVIDDTPAIIDALERAANSQVSPFVQQTPGGEGGLPEAFPAVPPGARIDSQPAAIAQPPVEVTADPPLAPITEPAPRAFADPPIDINLPPVPEAIPEPELGPMPVDGEMLVPEVPDGWYAEEYVDSYWYDLSPYVPSWVHRWEGSFDFGLTGSTGNSNNTNIGMGLHAKNPGDLQTWSVDMDYYFNQDVSGVTKNRFYGLGRYERSFDCSPYSWYFDVWYEYDRFAAFRSRIGFHTGLGVSLLEWDGGFLKARGGIGASRPMSGADAVWTPELQAGLDYEHQLTDRQKVFFHLDYYPDINDFGTFRVHARAGWELLIHDPSNLSIKLTAFNRYRTTADPGSDPNDLDYLLAISWGF